MPDPCASEAGRAPGGLCSNRRRHLEDLALFGCIAVALAGLAFAQDALAGSYDDDGIYLLGAKSMAEGRSYRALHLPGEPYQTKYPPLFSLLLSLVMRVAPGFPGNLPLLLLPGILCTAGAAVLWRRVLRDLLAFSGTASTCVVAGCFLGVPVVNLASMAMSEMVFSFLAAAAVLAAGARGRGAAMSAGLLCALACLTRSIGLTLPAGIVAWHLLHRRLRDAVVTLACFALLMAPWWWWQSLALRANGALAGDVSYAYDLSYGRWLLTLGQEVGVFWQNLVQSCYFLPTYLLPGSHVLWGQPLLIEAIQAHGFLRAFLVAGTWATALATSVLLGIGAVAALRRARHPLTGFLAAYLTAVLLWPFETARFFLPILPFVPAFVIEGAAVFLRRERRERVRTVCAVAFLAASLALLGVWWLWWRPAHIGGTTGLRAGMARMVELAGSAGGGVGPVAVSRGPMTTLYTGRKTLRLWPFDDPLMSYPSGRDLAFFYFAYNKDEPERLAPPATEPGRRRAKDVLGSMTRLGVRSLVVYPSMDALGEAVIENWARRLSLPLESMDRTFGIRVLALQGVVLDAFLR